MEFGSLSAALFPGSREARLYGVGVGVVTNNQDPEGQARVKVRCPWLGEAHESFWARLVTPMAGPGRGLYLLPEVDDEVLVAFEHGSPDSAFVLGALWNGVDRPPERGHDRRTLVSRSGHVIRMDDTQGKERVEIVDRSGACRIVIRTAEQAITIEAEGDVAITASHGKLTLSGAGVEINSTAGITMEGAQRVEVSASGPLVLKGATVDIN
jgi:phage baseplate assembly protein V